MTHPESEAYRRGVQAARGEPSAELARDLCVHSARGVFDTVGVLSELDAHELTCTLSLPGQLELVEAFAGRFRGLRASQKSARVEWYGHEALDFLAALYDDAEVFDPEKRLLYLSWATKVPIWSPGEGPLGELEWCALRPDAVAPKKERASDSGYDLTLLEKLKQLGEVELYGTGVQVRPPAGFYFDVVPRSSIIKRGYLLANSVGVIDRGYRGEIMVPLVRLSERTEPLELPARVVQLVPRPIVHFGVRRRESLDDTGRGSGGFGSTGR